MIGPRVEIFVPDLPEPAALSPWGVPNEAP